MKLRQSNSIASVGLTLVELLVAIAILSIIVALIVPRLRIVNKDRNIRETARVVGSAISAARDLAIAEGSAGIVIERNLNFVSRTVDQNNRVFFAGTRLFQLREKAPFTGDGGNDFVMVIKTLDADGNETLQCLLPEPLDHDPANDRFVVLQEDRVELDGFRYQVKQVLPVRNVVFRSADPGVSESLCGLNVMGSTTLPMLPLNLVFDDNADPTDAIDVTRTEVVTNAPAPNITPIPIGGSENGPFVVSEVRTYCDFKFERLRKVQSSAVSLPEGYIIDLRYSGPNDGAGTVDPGLDNDFETHTVLGLGVANGVNENDPRIREIQIIFDGRGAIDLMNVAGNSFTVAQSLSFFINEFDPNNVVDNDTRLQAERLLSGAGNLWVTVGSNGGVSIGNNSPPISGPVQNMISQARTISRSRVSTSQ